MEGRLGGGAIFRRAVSPTRRVICPSQPPCEYIAPNPCCRTPTGHHHDVREVGAARALGLLVDHESHARALAGGRLAQLLLQRAQQWQIRRQRDQLVQIIARLASEIGHAAMRLLEAAAELTPRLSL
jgi:hypothetical protein